MVSRENRIVGGFVVAALVLGYASTVLADVTSAVPLAILLGVGVVAPTLVTNYLGRTGAA
jgi:Sec-independent protein secretion pathway component TatC